MNKIFELLCEDVLQQYKDNLDQLKGLLFLTSNKELFKKYELEEVKANFSGDYLFFGTTYKEKTINFICTDRIDTKGEILIQYIMDDGYVKFNFERKTAIFEIPYSVEILILKDNIELKEKHLNEFFNLIDEQIKIQLDQDLIDRQIAFKTNNINIFDELVIKNRTLVTDMDGNIIYTTGFYNYRKRRISIVTSKHFKDTKAFLVDDKDTLKIKSLRLEDKDE